MRIRPLSRSAYSSAGPETLRRAHGVQPVSVLQTEYFLFERGVEAEVLPAARELGVGFVPYSPLGRGFLTSAVKPAEHYEEDNFRRHDARWKGENYRTNKRAVDRLNELAAEKGITAAQLALAWLLAGGQDIVPIPGTRTATRVEENLAAADVELTEADLARINEIVPDGAAGPRYTPEYMPTWV
ncbi:aldo/keto reductase [uncultured Arthrobacter sp.]|uniref:aldo/keto reductase n=1 Tax=uncultured Arthrobacter sp. TaxID=114050 RepID=UPI0028D17634|nr:aldo/keto reductase [uncultured Arthrobacter sp.]